MLQLPQRQRRRHPRVARKNRLRDFTPDDWANYAAQHKLQQRAYNLLKQAIKLGVLPPPHSQTCAVCRKPAHMYHHPNGYTGKAALDVTPVCTDCHGYLHSRYSK